jgi:hypothetical protein
MSVSQRPPDLCYQNHLTYLHIIEIRIDIRIQLLKQRILRDDALFQDEERLEDPGQSAGTFQVADVRFDGST